MPEAGLFSSSGSHKNTITNFVTDVPNFPSHCLESFKNNQLFFYNMDDMQNRVEAVLFITGSFMSIEEIAKAAGIASEGVIKEAVHRLKKEYEERQGSLEIINNDGRYKIALKKDYVQFSTRLLSTTELDRPTMETLAIIAYKQPIIQADLIKIRGNGAYDHIHTLKDQQFITSEKFGRTRKLKLAPKFFDYFDIAGDQLKSKCDEIGDKIGSVQELEKPQASLHEFKEEQENSEEQKEPEPSEPDPEPIPPDPEPIDPEEPDVKDPRKKEEQEETQ